jgi:hypothetical protein
MARSHPEFGIVDIGRDDLLEAAFAIFRFDHFHELIVNDGSFWIEKARARTELVEKEQLLFLADFAVISFGRFLLEMLPLFELLRVRKGNAVDSLQTLAIRVALPVGRGVFGQLKRLELARVTHVRTATQVNERTTPVHGCCGRVYFFI